jgi:hypothetical protein
MSLGPVHLRELETHLEQVMRRGRLPGGASATTESRSARRSEGAATARLRSALIALATAFVGRLLQEVATLPARQIA